MKVDNPKINRSGFINSPVYTKEKELSSVEKVEKMREKTWGRYEKEIGEALDELSKKPKSEWPKLFKK